MKIKSSGKLQLYFYTLIVLTSFVDAAVYWTMRPIWFFINKTANGIPLSIIMLAFLSASFIYSLVLLTKCLKKHKDNNHIKQAIEMNMSAIAITDHDTILGLKTPLCGICLPESVYENLKPYL